MFSVKHYYPYNRLSFYIFQIKYRIKKAILTPFGDCDNTICSTAKTTRAVREAFDMIC